MAITIPAISFTSPRQAERSQAAVAKALERLSSGQRINRAADDPAGLVISEQLRAQLESLSKADDNLAQGIDVIQTADGALSQTQELIQRQRDLALQAGNDAVLDPAQREALDREYQALGQAIDRISQTTQYGRNRLLDGSYQDRAIQAGTQSGQTIDLSIASRVTGEAKGFDQAGLGLSGTSLLTADGASAALGRIDTALDEVGRQRGSLGATQANAVESARRSLAVAYANLAGSESTIRDTDFARESANLISSQIQAQAGLAAVASGNQLGSGLVAQLLG